MLSFKEKKAAHEAALAAAEQARRDDADAHEEAVESMERRFLEEKSRLQSEYKQQLAEVQKSSQEQAVERLDASTKKILFENRRLAAELKLQVRETDELQAAHQSLEAANRRLKQEVALNEQHIKECAKQGHRRNKENGELSSKVRSLERYVSSATREFDRERGALAATDRKKAAEAELDAAGLRQLVRLKTRELANVKRLAALVLQKRSEVEIFLLESIEQVGHAP